MAHHMVLTIEECQVQHVMVLGLLYNLFNLDHPLLDNKEILNNNLCNPLIVVALDHDVLV